MGTVKATFTFDELTARRLEESASRLGMAKSQVVREAIQEFHDRIGRLSEQERVAMLRVFDEVVPRIPARNPESVQRELREIRAARRRGGRRK
jgi:hypothetical protein